MQRNPHSDKILKTIQRLGYVYSTWNVFSDFVELGALAIANSADKKNRRLAFMKTCRICGKPIEFGSRAKKFCSEECREREKYNRNRAWLAAHPGKGAEYSRKSREANPERAKQVARDAYRRKVLRQIKEESENENKKSKSS